MHQEITENLLAKYFANEASEEEKAHIEDWLKKDPENRLIFSEYQQLWNSPLKIKEHKFDPSLVYTKVSDAILEEKKARSRSFTYRFLRFAASILLFVGLAGTWLFFSNLPPKQLSKKTEYGQKLKFTLPDGSLVYLNSGSTIDYPENFSEDNRQVALVGEAFFEVKKDKHRPFIINSGSMKTTVLGTSFNVSAYPHASQSVEVLSGKVKVSSEIEEVVLVPGQKASLEKGMINKYEVKTSEISSWRNGTLSFRDSPLSTVVVKLERWYNVQISLEEELKKCVFTGSFTSEKLPVVLEVLKETFGISYQINAQKITIKGKACNNKQ
ncbi:hypothetical protein C9994_15070 [Marivirga lumbricoides]|uniref:Iron dicitrate transport regulator FecR n=1 Tax=Marivirga lumbricoides TaxID=1046115 RepID=A0A2T4DD19_9BACT|nr:hypothetical protein C9994_15070 [Marivirga lumbricoides]